MTNCMTLLGMGRLLLDLIPLVCIATSTSFQKLPVLHAAMPRAEGLVWHADIAPDRFTYNALLEAHTAAEDLEGVARLYKAMLTRGIRPDICTFVALFQVTAPHQR